MLSYQLKQSESKSGPSMIPGGVFLFHMEVGQPCWLQLARRQDPGSSQKPSAFLTTAGGNVSLHAEEAAAAVLPLALTAPLINGGLHQASILAEE